MRKKNQLFPVISAEEVKLRTFFPGQHDIVPHIPEMPVVRQAGIKALRIIIAKEYMQAGFPVTILREAVQLPAFPLFDRFVPICPDRMPGINRFQNRHLIHILL